MTRIRALVSWVVLLAVAFLNGALRVTAYPAALSDFAARQVACGVGAVLLGGAIWLLLRRWPIATARQGWLTGALWTGLTVVFEAAMTLVGGGTWDQVLAQYALWEGSLWPLLLLWVLAAPRAVSAVQRSGTAVGATILCGVACWMVCGMVMMGGRSLFGIEAALVIHLLAAPFVGAGFALLLWRHPRHPGVVPTAAALAGIPALLDAIVVAPFLERSFEMFASPVGTWIPLGLIFAAAAGATALSARATGIGSRRTSSSC
jgi:hypothetical protein